MSAVPDGIPPAIFELIRGAFNTRFTMVTAITIVVFEHLITIDEEWELIWKKPWSFSKFLFILNRYFTLGMMIINGRVWLGGTPNDIFCRGWLMLQGYGGWTMNMTVQIIILVRLKALFSARKKIMYPMYVGFFLEGWTMFAIITWQLLQRKASHQPFPGVFICTWDKVPPKLWTYWLVNIIYEGVLMSAAGYRAYTSWREGNVNVHGGKSLSLFEILVRDSMLYFVFIFATYLLNLVAWYIQVTAMYQIAIALALGIRCVMGSRLLLNVRSAYYGQNPDAGHSTHEYDMKPRSRSREVGQNSYTAHHYPGAIVVDTNSKRQTTTWGQTPNRGTRGFSFSRTNKDDSYGSDEDQFRGYSPATRKPPTDGVVFVTQRTVQYD